VAYYSKTIASAELNYVVYDKEILAIVRSFSNFYTELAGSSYKVVVYTNYKALEYFMTSKPLNAR
jgi:hypothetical protein